MTLTRAEHQLEAPSAVIASYLRKTISLSYLAGLAWSGRLIVAACTVAGLLFGIYSVYHRGPSYMATMRISPASDDAGSMGGLAGANGLLAGLSGDPGALQVPKFIQFLYAMDSLEVARTLDQKYDLLCRVYHGDCDPVTHQWKARDGIREWITSVTFRLSGLPDPNVGPRSVTDLAQYIEGQVIAAKLKKTDSVNTLTYVNRNPQFAAQFLALVVKTTNDYIRAQNREIQKRYVDYLSASAAKTTNVEQRQAIDTLLLQEERQLMMTEVDIPYAAQILDGPTVTPVNRALKIIAVYTAFGFILGIVISISRDLLPRKWRRW
jgi:hypothetical protein